MRLKSNKGKWIAVDLDGTIAQYTKFISPCHIGEPIPEMVEIVKRYIDGGYTVKIFTARVSVSSQALAAEVAIKKWCLKHIGVELDVTCIKHTNFVKFIDDRAVRAIKNTGMLVGDWQLD